MAGRRKAALSAALTTLILTSALPLRAQSGTAVRQETARLTVQHIMRGPDLVGTSPSDLRWSPDGQAVYFVWKEPGTESEALYRVPRGGGAPERLSQDVGLRIDPMLDAVLSKDRRRAAYADEGDLYLLDVRSGGQRLLLSSHDDVSSVQIAPDGSAVYFVSEMNLFRVGVEDGSVTQLTDIRRGEKPEEEEPEGQRAFLQGEQRELFRVFAEDSLREARSWPPPEDTVDVDAPEPFYVADGERVSGYHVSPDGTRLAFTLTAEAEGAREAWVPDYVTEEGYTEQAPRKRTFVGDEQPASRMGLMDLGSGEVVFSDHGQGDRRVDLLFRGWSEKGHRVLAVGVSYDYHDRWILVVDPESGESRVIDHLHDDAWIGGPSWSSAGWLPGDDHVWFVSEQSGFAHVYRRALGGGDPIQLTSGPWEVIQVSLTPDEKEFHLVTSESSPHERHVYRMDRDGRHRERITSGPSVHGESGRDISSVAIDPSGKRLAVLLSEPNRPPELYLQDNEPGARATRITESRTEAFRSGTWIVPEIVYITAVDGTEVPARLYRPETPNGAGVIFVHGAGYLQNVHRWWSVYYREYMFHNLLAEHGYTVLDIDYRGSAGYGRDWRTAIRKHMGGTDLGDQVDGAHFLAETMEVDPARIGIYGGSYGGFITLMAMFTQPRVFAAGAALRPVTDWAYYNHWYTSRILGLPQNDREAYRRSSPIYHAEGLEGALLMAHGMIDQNVHFQDVVRLAQRLIELGKDDWEVAIYPKEDHGFVHAFSWTDEYRRILELFDENLLDRETAASPETSSK